MISLLITQKLPDAVTKRAEEHFEVSVRDGGPMSESEAKEALGRYDAIIPTLGDGFRGAAFSDVEIRTKVLANFGVGYNHIDVGAARERAVIVTNTPGAVTDATADIAVTLMLMACRRASEGERIVRAGNWTGWQPTQLLGMHVTGKTVGVIGMGRIGKAIARRCHQGFGMRVVYFNRSEVSDPHVPGVQVGTLNDLLETSDVAILAVPATPDTRHMIGAKELAVLGSRSYLINIARGDVVDEAALVDALKNRTIAGAGLDVYEHEPELAPGLAASENVVLLPHLGTAALEVRNAMGFMALENAVAVIDGRPPPNPV